MRNSKNKQKEAESPDIDLYLVYLPDIQKLSKITQNKAKPPKWKVTMKSRSNPPKRMQNHKKCKNQSKQHNKDKQIHPKHESYGRPRNTWLKHQKLKKQMKDSANEKKQNRQNLPAPKSSQFNRSTKRKLFFFSFCIRLFFLWWFFLFHVNFYSLFGFWWICFFASGFASLK